MSAVAAQRAISILLVEDSPLDSRLLLEALKPAVSADELIVQTVKRLAQAVEAVKASDIACVLLDLGLPDGQGVDNVTALREADPKAAIVVLTGLDDEATANAALQRGAQDYLVKGETDPGHLIRLIRRAVQRNLQTVALETRRGQDFFEATHDPLTLLPNAALFADRGRQALAAARAAQTPFVLGWLRIEGMAEWRRTQGTLAADEWLRQLSQRLADQLPAPATLGRLELGEAEGFGLFGLHPADAQLHLAQLARQMAASAPTLRLLHGIVEADGTLDFAGLVARARQPVAAAAVAAARPSVVAPSARHDAALAALRWQPWIEVRASSYGGVELLLYEGQPARATLEAAARLATQWQSWSAARFEPPLMALRLPAALLTDALLLPQLVDALRVVRPAARVQLHVGEAAFRDLPRHTAALQRLRAEGFRLVLEGDGSSDIPLSDFAGFPVDAYRLSQGFQRQLLSETLQGRSRRMLTAMIGAAEALGAQVMAAGVDTAESASALRLMGVHVLQGRAIAPACVPDALPLMWERGPATRAERAL